MYLLLQTRGFSLSQSSLALGQTPLIPAPASGSDRLDALQVSFSWVKSQPSRLRLQGETGQDFSWGDTTGAGASLCCTQPPNCLSDYASEEPSVSQVLAVRRSASGSFPAAAGSQARSRAPGFYQANSGAVACSRHPRHGGPGALL